MEIDMMDGRAGSAAETAPMDALRPLEAMSQRAADDLIAEMGARARKASSLLALAPTAQKADALLNAARLIRERSATILSANEDDLRRSDADGTTPPMRDRLKLDGSRIEQIASALEAVAALRDPVGQEIDSSAQPNGLLIKRVRVPLGVIAIIYESRPNVTTDAGGLALMAGNAAILRGGSEARATNDTLHKAIVGGIVGAGLPRDSIQLVPTLDRAAVGALLRGRGLVDVIIPRGGKGLVQRVQEEARVPVLAHLEGINHTFVHAAAEAGMADRLVVNAKMRRTIVCGSTETLLIDRGYQHAARLVAALADAGCSLRGDEAAAALDPRVIAAAPEDWDTEYLDSICSVAVVDGLDGALRHIARHSSHHTDAIVTDDEQSAKQFLASVDSAVVMWNASTQFADGGEFGLGAEIGIATGRLHARGPVALEGLTTYKWQVYGTGQARP